MRRGHSVKLFAEKSFSDERRKRKKELRDKIQDENANRILNTNKDKYIDYILSKYQYDKVNINTDDARFDPEKYASDTDVTVIVPIRGNKEILKYKPSSWRESVGRYSAKIKEVKKEEEIHELHVELEPLASRKGWGGRDPQEEVDKLIEFIEHHWEILEQDIEKFNDELQNTADKEFDKRSEEARKYREKFGNLDIDLQKKDGTPETFSIEAPERRKTIEKPEARGETAGEFVPTVSDKSYYEILKAINDIGKGFERSPRLFEYYEEEDLRDFILFFLEMNFEYGTATGETFNMSGKTDILLRSEDGENVFIAECAIWSGKEGLKDKVDQLFGYLTWRDSKAAIVCFVTRKSIEPVLEKIEESANGHEAIDNLQEKKGESWFQYKAHFPSDPDREVDIGILAFHIPEE